MGSMYIGDRTILNAYKFNTYTNTFWILKNIEQTLMKLKREIDNPIL